MRALMLLVTCVTAHLFVTGCKKRDQRDQVETSAPLRVTEPAPFISPRAQFKWAANPGEKPQGRIVANPLLSADGKRVAVVANFPVNRTQFWSLEGEPRKLSDIDGLAVLLLPDGKRAICMDKGYGSTSIVDLETGHKTPIPNIASSNSFVSGDTVITPFSSVGGDRPEPLQIGFYDLKSGKESERLNIGKDNRARCALINQGREIVYIFPRENRGGAYDWKAKKTTRDFKLGGKAGTMGRLANAWADLRFSQPDGKWIAVTRDGVLPEIFDGRTGEVAAKVPEMPYGTPGEFVPGKDLFIYNNYKNPRTPKIAGMVAYGIKEQNHRAYFQDYTSLATRYSFSSDGRVMASSHEDGSILIWDLDRIK